ncbi:putative serine threonine protein kinase domain protein [Erysiphe necator]|uniref:Putative serine threonine protein kinase domain protein n=1 Tax=Uncinula necator TaxID=52586 RepID=A0A0B1P297_UNCNE|nr:putative serine threonine protein kinase domain protein [Erysiphe necator]
MIVLTESSSVFLQKRQVTRATMLWSTWWVAKLKQTVPHVKTAPSDSPLITLTTIVNISLANRQANLMTITHRFWTYEPLKEISVGDFIKEYQKRYQDLREHTSITSEVEYQMMYLLLHDISTIQPDLVTRCWDLIISEMLYEYLRWTSTTQKSKSQKSQGSVAKCNFCSISKHTEQKCREKKRMVKEGSVNKKDEKHENKVFTLNHNIDNATFQLDTGADIHVSRNKLVKVVVVSSSHLLTTKPRY